VGGVVGGRDGALRPFSYHAVMIARERALDHFGTVGPVCQRRGASAALTAAARGVTGGVASQVL
jgi:hypothetical protein